MYNRHVFSENDTPSLALTVILGAFFCGGNIESWADLQERLGLQVTSVWHQINTQFLSQPDQVLFDGIAIGRK